MVRGHDDPDPAGAEDAVDAVLAEQDLARLDRQVRVVACSWSLTRHSPLSLPLFVDARRAASRVDKRVPTLYLTTGTAPSSSGRIEYGQVPTCGRRSARGVSEVAGIAGARLRAALL